MVKTDISAISEKGLLIDFLNEARYKMQRKAREVKYDPQYYVAANSSKDFKDKKFDKVFRNKGDLIKYLTTNKTADSYISVLRFKKEHCLFEGTKIIVTRAPKTNGKVMLGRVITSVMNSK